MFTWPYGQPHTEKCLIEDYDEKCLCHSRWKTFVFKMKVWFGIY